MILVRRAQVVELKGGGGGGEGKKKEEEGSGTRADRDYGIWFD